MLRLKDLTLVESKEALGRIPEGKVLINTINAHSYNVAQQDEAFADALRGGDYLVPDGAAVVMACRWLKGRSMPKERIAGWDLFCFEMRRVKASPNPSEEGGMGYGNETLRYENETASPGPSEGGGMAYENGNIKKRVMFMGSSERVLTLIRERAAREYPNVEVVTYSPPYKAEFSEEENAAIVKAINDADPDLLWIGMTAPKQEKWTFEHWEEMNIHCHVGTIGAVFDFYAGTVKRAPLWWQRHSLEWLYRLVKEPGRMWRRYLIGNPLFVWNILRKE